MRRLFPILSPPMAFALLLTGWLGSAPSRAGAEEEAKEPCYTFVGVKKCKICHKKKSTGDQYGIWKETLHAKAYENLATEKALEAARKQGIENPQEAPECLKCHVTAFPVMEDLVNQKITLEEGVSCESCHGPGSGYYKKSTMQAIANGEVEGASVGLRMPPPAEVCTQCHNPDSPFYKKFDYEEFKAKIAHPRPKKQ